MKRKIQRWVIHVFCKEEFYDRLCSAEESGFRRGELKWQGQMAGVVRNAVHEGQRTKFKGCV